MKKIRIMIVDDHTIVREGLRTLIALAPDMEVACEAENGLEALSRAEEARPQVVLMDISMPLMDGLEATKRITERHKETKVIILTQYEDKDEVLRAIRSGARGFVSKRAASSELIQAIRAVAAGNAFFSPPVANILIEEMKTKRDGLYEPLTDREREVLRLVAEGYTDKEIAGLLSLSPKTVEAHKTKIMGKLSLTKKADLIKYAIKKGIIKL